MNSAGADTALNFSNKSNKTMIATLLKDFTMNTEWTYTIATDCYIQIISPVGTDAWGIITINDTEIEIYNSNIDNSSGWGGGYSNVYFCKKGDVIISLVKNPNHLYRSSLIQWN